MAKRAVGRFLKFGVLRGLRSVEIDPEEFRRNLAEKHGLWVPHFGRMKDAPLEKLDAIAERLIHDAQKDSQWPRAPAFGLGGMITIIPDTGFLTVITLRLIQKLCLLYGFDGDGKNAVCKCGWLRQLRPELISAKILPRNRCLKNLRHVWPAGLL